MAAAKRSKGTVGMIGLGIMGGAFAKNLAAAGWRVVGYDISAARRREAERAGVEIARSAVEVAASAPTVPLLLFAAAMVPPDAKKKCTDARRLLSLKRSEPGLSSGVSAVMRLSCRAAIAYRRRQ